MDYSRKSTVNFTHSHRVGTYIKHRVLSHSAVARFIVLCRPTQLSQRHILRRAPWCASSSGRSRTYCSVEPAPATLAYTGNGRIQLPKVWSANTYRHSLISKVVGVPVREKAAYFFFSLLPYIYIITIFLEFFKLFLR